MGPHRVAADIVEFYNTEFLCKLRSFADKSNSLNQFNPNLQANTIHCTESPFKVINP
jgi:hypothetical protein